MVAGACGVTISALVGHGECGTCGADTDTAISTESYGGNTRFRAIESPYYVV